MPTRFSNYRSRVPFIERIRSPVPNGRVREALQANFEEECSSFKPLRETYHRDQGRGYRDIPIGSRRNIEDCQHPHICLLECFVSDRERSPLRILQHAEESDYGSGIPRICERRLSLMSSPKSQSEFSLPSRQFMGNKLISDKLSFANDPARPKPRQQSW